ncbi:MAG: HigA family addiction module antidote protein [Desulfarculaceae bacterium]|nr:HigA family addiction module antidote protein [Desulfarculaceae bacterium]MCF8071728.1 HigA family addiction module antidote protein [Desulfarculaceae bacterium]MCF8102425.1 HigA family addiction module antidote protein [Desulfarculaceae bacterium]MCF8116767.1 HigA family addiction module antidote protein [Desulfarculaceae bacterium]
MIRNEPEPMHPGDVLLDQFMVPRRETLNGLAATLGVPLDMLRRVISGEASMSLALAHKLAQHYGLAVNFWLRLQGRYDQQAA